jgi:hypothetical protein
VRVAPKEFVTEVDLRATLAPLTLPVLRAQGTFRLPPVLRYSVSILSIELPKWHWEKIRHKEVFKDIDERRHVNPGHRAPILQGLPFTAVGTDPGFGPLPSRA